MSEYRRFIAYFYEYIEEKKQKSAGFAKVELRNGMWRILFHLTTDIVPDDPVQAFGFVREKGYLVEFPLGTMPAGREVSEEWAYRSDSLMGHGRYRFADLSGIWIRSGDGRNFITVWDDEPLQPGKFVTEIPRENGKEEVIQTYAEPRGEDGMPCEAETGKGDDMLCEAGSGKEEAIQMQTETGEDGKTSGIEAVLRGQESGKEKEIYPEAEIAAQETGREGGRQPETLPAAILQKRKAFHPFQDEEIVECVQILPCDIVRLQQESWKVGRSSFLQHGFYQYRHLLLGRQQDGNYVIGVPGIRNPQEKYMAEMFGYNQFKTSRCCGCGKSFGYWYRTLTQ